MTSQGMDPAIDPRYRTVDGVRIVDELRVWDYDLLAGSVDFTRTRRDGPYWDGWFTVLCDDGTRSIMNGERLTTRHPFTRAAVPALLVWESAGTDEYEDVVADSVSRVEAGATSAFYAVGPDAQGWSVDLIQVRDRERVLTRLGHAEDATAARCRAQLWEDDPARGR